MAASAQHGGETTHLWYWDVEDCSICQQGFPQIGEGNRDRYHLWPWLYFEMLGGSQISISLSIQHHLQYELIEWISYDVQWQFIDCLGAYINPIWCSQVGRLEKDKYQG